MESEGAIAPRQRDGRDRAVRHQRFADNIRCCTVTKLSGKRDWRHECYGVIRPMRWSDDFAPDVDEHAYDRVGGGLRVCRDRVRDSVEGSAAPDVSPGR